MTYSNKTRVWHLNNVAGVAGELVSFARGQGKSWRLRPLPAGRGTPWHIAHTRLLDLGRYLPARSSADILHLHYAANGYYAWGTKLPWVLHIHGSDLRKDLHSRILGTVIRRSISQASAVVCATPDLLEPLQQLRPDALWLPNPVCEQSLQVPKRDPLPGRVVFNMRWDDTKGADKLVEAADQLHKRGVELLGLDWGDKASLAAGAGVKLLPLMGATEFFNFLASAQVVVGQHSFGSLSMTEMQVMALGRPLVGYVTNEDAPIFQASADAIADTVLDVLADPEAGQRQAQKARQWVIDNHRTSYCVEKLEDLYRRLG